MEVVEAKLQAVVVVVLVQPELEWKLVQEPVVLRPEPELVQQEPEQEPEFELEAKKQALPELVLDTAVVEEVL